MPSHFEHSPYARYTRALSYMDEVKDDPSEADPPFLAPESLDARPTERRDIVLRSSRLLNLPAEIRNCIYVYILVEDKPLAVTPGLKLPALLATCYKVRYEGLEIWFLENEFEILLIDCDASLLRAFRKLEAHAISVSSQKAKLKITLRGLKWANLVSWCCDIFHDPAYTNWCGMQPARNTMYAAVAVVSAAHQITRNACQQSSWEEVKAQLDALHMVAGKVDKEWLS
ncbi:hypothetical protein LTR37_010305 [Vermiconidia calcicola]|uniref:Uncharacterized protein n=1 Tax=Vermiconidia calcicola TaxID=1690605 RepID=A0ACC3N5E1_9PEZI|nr:hypothetical protein LTR37_010305 [Vermiconidia calcicola]